MNLSELDPDLLKRPDLGTSVSDRARSLAMRSLEELTPGDLAFCLRQSIALKHTVPLALRLLAETPILDSGSYPGDLLWSLLHISKAYALSELERRELWDICSDAAASIKALSGEVLPEIEAYFGRSAST